MSTNLKKYFTLTQLFILVLVANVISCKCSKNGDNQEENTGKLTMEVAPLQLDSTKPTTTVTFQLTEPGKKADLTKFQLKARIAKQEDGTGSKLKYQDAAGNNQEAEKIDAPLTDFTSLTSLADDNAPLKIDFTVLADKNVTLLVYQFEAFDADNNAIGSFDVTYQPKKNPELATLKLESNPQLEGNQKEIKLELHNPSSETLAAGALKLQVKRTLGKDAIILGSMPTATPDTYELAINEEILATLSLHKTFMIDSQTDAKAAFEIQLIQAVTSGNTGNTGNKTTVHWEKGAWIDLTVKHEGNPRQLTYSVINSGTKEIKHAKLQYSCETTGIQLAGKALTKDQPEELTIGDLEVNKKIENQVLGAIDFGTNPNANFVCKVIYEGGASEEKKISCTAADVQLSIEGLTYDVATNQISYSIRNAGQDKADGVQMRYTNESKDEAAKKVTINNQTTATEAQVNIPKTATTAPVNLPIDFKQADEATFKFELLYKGMVISQTTKTFQAKAVKLKLVAASVATVASNLIALTGGNLAFECKILSEVDGRLLTEIDPTQVQINIKDNKGNTSSFISQISGATAGINHLTGPDLGTLGDELTLYLNPKTEKEAAFSLTLTYKNIPQGRPLTISWKEETIEIQDLYPFVGNNEASFSLYSSGSEIAHDQLTIELTSNNHATFTLIQQDDSDGGTSLTLDQLIGADETPVNTKTDPIRFKLATNPHNDGSSQVTIHIKHNANELASQTVTWKAQEISLKITISDAPNLLTNKNPYKLQVENMGEEVDTNKIIFRFINDKNVDFKIGTWSTKTTGDTSLKNIINKERLAVNEKIEFKIQQDATTNPDIYGADITIELLDATGISLSKQDFSWLNQLKIDTELKPLVVNKLQNLKRALKENKREFGNKKVNNWSAAFKAIQAMIQLKSDLDGLLIKVSHLDRNKMHKALVEFIADKVNQNNELIGKAHEQIITGLEYTKWGVTHFSEEAKKILQNLKSNTEPQDQAIKKLEENLLDMRAWLHQTDTLVNQYNIKEAQQILQEAQEIATETEEAAKNTKPKPIIQEMIEHANKQRMWFTEQILTKLQNGEMVDINEAPKGYPTKFTALWEVINNITSESRYLSATDQDIIKALLDRGADLTIPDDKSNKTALDLAASNQHYDNVLKFLLDEILARDLQKVCLTTFTNNRTLLHMAANANIPLNKEISKLLEKNLDIEAKDAAGNTPLLLAVTNGHIENIELLLAKGAKTNVKNMAGYTPLIWTVMTKTIDGIDIMQLLLDKEAQINAPADNNKTPLHYAVELNKLSNTKWLLDNGADVQLQDKNGKTAYDYISTALRDSKDPVQIVLRDRLNPNNAGIC